MSKRNQALLFINRILTDLDQVPSAERKTHLRTLDQKINLFDIIFKSEFNSSIIFNFHLIGPLQIPPTLIENNA